MDGVDLQLVLPSIKYLILTIVRPLYASYRCQGRFPSLLYSNSRQSPVLLNCIKNIIDVYAPRRYQKFFVLLTNICCFQVNSLIP